MDELCQKANIFDYLSWRGDLGFDVDKINKLDLIVFTQIALLDLDGIVMGMESDEAISIYDAYHKFIEDKRQNKKIGLIIPDAIKRMFNKIHKLNRFKNVEMMHYINEISIDEDKQISALTFKISDNEYVISFSGTDDTIIGWKENVKMMYKFPVASQVRAKEYVDMIISKYDKAKFYITGHSKGGNMTLYSAYACSDDSFKKIVGAYSFDGQGLTAKDESFFDEARGKKIVSYFPQASIVGVIFNHKEKINYVRSIQEGAYQHDVFSWLVMGNDFVYEKSLTKDSLAFKDKINDTIASMTDSEKEKFTENLYKVLSAYDSKDLLSLSEKKLKVWEVYFKLSKEDRKYIYDPVHRLLKDKSVMKALFDTFRGMMVDNKKEKLAKQKK